MVTRVRTTDAIRSTTPAERTERRPGGDRRPARRPLALAGASLALAGGLLLLGIPRVASGIVSLPGNRIIGDLRYDRPVSGTDVAILMRSRAHALDWFEDRAAWSDVGLAHLLAAGDPALDDNARRSKLQAAVEAIRHGLSLAPGDGYVWAR